MPKTQAPEDEVYTAPPTSHPIVFPAFWLLVFIGTLTASGPWAERHFIFFGTAGVLMLLFPPVVKIPRGWWILAVLFLLFGAACFLPASWFGMPEWRTKLEGLGVRTGSQVVIQSRMAFEMYLYFGAMGLACLWFAGQRVPSNQIRIIALLFGMGAAVYAVLAALMPNVNGQNTYGFFANRNHTATYLAMGAVCASGVAFQFIRDKTYVRFSLAVLSAGICYWAILFQSVSRAGILLLAVGACAWLWLVGGRYFGANGKRLVILGGVLLVGIFFMVDSTAKKRLSETMENRVGTEAAMEQQADYRLLVAKDTADMISQFPLTGVGGGQYPFLSGLYRKRTFPNSDSSFAHPESDWLWLTAELGIPAALCLLAITVWAAIRTLKSIKHGRARAVRAASCAAGLLLLLHSIFDVPGHHVPLAFASVLLLTLALYQDGGLVPGRVSAAVSRCLGLLLIAISAGILWLGGGDRMGLDILLGKKLPKQATALANADIARGRPPQEGETDGIQEAIDLLGQGISRLPLDTYFRLRRGIYLTFYSGSGEEKVMLGDFAVERTLRPYPVIVPMTQAGYLQNAGLWPETVEAWSEAVARAKRIDDFSPRKGKSLETMTLGQIRFESRTNPELKKLVTDKFGP